jgi:hypothetical protein
MCEGVMKKIITLLITLYINLFSQISLTGGPYTQSFDSYLGTSISVPIGWTVTFQLTPVYNGTGTGTSNAGGAWAYGTSGEYSFGALRSGTPGNITLAVNFTNNTGQTIVDMTFQWNYEQWRYANTSGFDLSGTGVLSGNTSINTQDFSGSSTGTNGTVTSTPISINLLSINILDGQTFGLQWITTDLTGADNGISIDDFQLTGPDPLPVELSSFSAVVLDNGVKLNWRTGTEVSNYGFEILRQAQDDKWNVLGFVEGHGNSNSPKEYSFIDENVSGGQLSYRLKQIDTDGQFEYSKIIEVDLGSPQKFELSQNYPNPFNPTTTIRFSLLQSGYVKLAVYNLIGEKVAELVNGFKEAGIHTINFNAENLNSGLYIYKIESNGFVQSRKMTLIK